MTQIPEVKLDMVTLVRDIAVISGTGKKSNITNIFSSVARKMPGQQNNEEPRKASDLCQLKVFFPLATLPQNHSSLRVPTPCPCKAVSGGNELGSKRRD